MIPISRRKQIVGVAVVGGAATGGYFLFKGGSPSEGTLKIQW